VPERPGPSTRSVHAGLPAAEQGQPFLPGPVFASAFHLAGDDVHTGYGYQRDGNPTWTHYEQALGEFEGGEVVLFGSGMAAVSALMLRLGPGDVFAGPDDAYPGVRNIAREHLAPRGVEVRLGPSDQRRLEADAQGATMVWAETPVNPGLQVIDVPAVVAAAGDAVVVVDGTLAGPLRQRPLEMGATYSVVSASKHLTGHSDLLLGYVATTDPERAEELRQWRILTGAVAGPLETWLAHRSLATYALRLERMEANAAAVAESLAARDDVTDVRWPGVGSVLGFDLGSADAGRAFLAACELVIESTSFGGVHSNAERRARWGYGGTPEGWIRFSAGIEDTVDLVADVTRALDSASR
jgi:cystathionine gamma-lyase